MSQDKAIAALDMALEKTAGVGARIDLILAKVRMGLFYSDVELVTANIVQATGSVPCSPLFLISLCSWCQPNRFWR